MKKLSGYFLMEFLSEIRSKETIIWSFIFPLILFFILNLTVGGAISGEEKRITFRYTFIGKGDVYEKLIGGMFKNISVFEEKKVGNIDEALSLLKKGKVDIVIFIPKKGLSLHKKIDIYYVDERTSSHMAKSIVEEIFNKINLGTSIGLQYAKYYTIKNTIQSIFWVDISPLLEKMKPIEYRIEGLSPSKKENLSYKDYLFPGILLMALITLGAFYIPLRIAFYREARILKRLFVTPVTSWILFAGNLFTFFLIALLQVSIFTAFSIYVMGVSVNPFSPKIILYILLTFVFSYTMGFSIASISKSTQSANLLGNAFFFPLQFLGGLYFPKTSTPWFIKWFIVINPLTYISSGIREEMGLLSSPYPLYLSFLVPLLWIGVLTVFIIKRFSWLGDEK